MASFPTITCDGCKKTISMREDGGPNMGQVRVELLDWINAYKQKNPMNQEDYMGPLRTILNGDFCGECFMHVQIKMARLIQEVNELCLSPRTQ